MLSIYSSCFEILKIRKVAPVITLVNTFCQRKILLVFQGGVSLVSNIQGVHEMWYGRLIYEGVINLRLSSLALHIGFDLFLEFRR